MISELAAAAVGALAPYLSAAGTKAAQALGAEAANELTELWVWVKTKVADRAKDAFAEAPTDAKAQAKLEGALEQALDAEPALADELRRLAERAQPQAARLQQVIQKMHVEGHGNVAIQSEGGGNTFNVTKG